MAHSGSKKKKSLETQVDMHYYTRFKKRRSLNDQADIDDIDKISDLPRDVLTRIMECLPLRDAARMSVVSRKWQGIWTSIPSLAFDAHFFARVLRRSVPETHQFCSIVSKILFQHEGSILKFTLWVPPVKTCPDVTQWISFLSRSGLREFGLCNMFHTPLKLSSHLFSCDSLETLNLYNCIYSPPPNLGGFPRLTSLELCRVNIVCRTLKDVIGSCPVLQNLVLKNFSGMEDRHLIIDVPLLRNLVVDGAFASIDVTVSENLVSASFVLQKMTKNCPEEGNSYDLINSLANSSKLEWLCLGGYFCKVLFEKQNLPNTSPKLKNLELLSLHLNDLDDFSSAISSIQSFPNIETLDISVNTSKNLDNNVLVYDPDFILHHLRCAKIGIWSASSTELKLIEFLLACSPVLEKLSISLTTPLKQGSHSKMSTQLNRFRRASPKVEVICPERKVFPKKLPHGLYQASFTSSPTSQHISIDSLSSDYTEYYSDASS